MDCVFGLWTPTNIYVCRWQTEIWPTPTMEFVRFLPSKSCGNSSSQMGRGNSFPLSTVLVYVEVHTGRLGSLEKVTQHVTWLGSKSSHLSLHLMWLFRHTITSILFNRKKSKSRFSHRRRTPAIFLHFSLRIQLLRYLNNQKFTTNLMVREQISNVQSVSIVN